MEPAESSNSRHPRISALLIALSICHVPQSVGGRTLTESEVPCHTLNLKKKKTENKRSLWVRIGWRAGKAGRI